MSKPLFALILCLVIGGLMACSRPAEPTPTTAPTPAATTPDTPAAAPTTSPTNTPTPPPTPILPAIAATNQVLTDGGELTIASVMATEPGWLVVYARGEDELGEILGVTAVDTGNHTGVRVTIDPLQATASLAAVLHVDRGETGEFEYPEGPDEPVTFESATVATAFDVEFELSLPVIDVASQQVLEDGLVHVESVTALAPGWLVIHGDAGGEPGLYLGSAPLQAGLNEELWLRIPWRQASSTLYAIIYEDGGQAQRLELGTEDTPFLVNGEPAMAAFTVTYPPDLFVMDQPVVDGQIEVQRVTSDGPGWLVVYFDNEGEPGLIIGHVALEDGVNENVVVEVVETAVTNPLYVRVHEDTEPGDAFDFPRVDPPITYNERQVRPISFDTQPGNYLVVHDQTVSPPTEDGLQIEVAYAIMEAPGWLVIHQGVAGQPGPILGTAPLKAGLNRDIVVDLETPTDTETLFAALYLDGGEIGLFEPEGEDGPIQRNRQMIGVSFLVEIGAD